jgi:hypothetical protein
MHTRGEDAKESGMIIQIVSNGRPVAFIRHADEIITSDQLVELMAETSGNQWNWKECNRCNQQLKHSHAVAA